MNEYHFEFYVAEHYAERELEELLETIENRGGDYQHLKGAAYEVVVPEELDYIPFYKAVLECPSVSDVVRSISLRAVLSTSIHRKA